MAGSVAVLLVGHCGPDTWVLMQFVRQVLPQAQVDTVNDDAGLNGCDPAGVILLVNRVLDGSFAVGSGIDLIRRWRQQPGGGPALLISNYPDAQAEAEAAGALPGFGKAQLGLAQAQQRLRAAAATMGVQV